MTSPPQQDWQQKLRDLEQEINSAMPVRPFNPQGDAPQPLHRLLNWYQGLTTPAKAAVAVVAAVIGLSVLNSVLKLVASLITIAILGVVLYALYRAFVAGQPSDGSP